MIWNLLLLFCGTNTRRTKRRESELGVSQDESRESKVFFSNREHSTTVLSFNRHGKFSVLCRSVGQRSFEDPSRILLLPVPNSASGKNGAECESADRQKLQ